jgi:hypothetical protein
MKLTEPRPYSDEWRSAEPQPLETKFGTVSIQPLGWGIRVESGPDDEPLFVNGSHVRLGWADFNFEDGRWMTKGNVWVKKATGLGFDDATPKQRDKLLAELPALVTAWAEANVEEIERRKWAYVSDRARTCEESILELEEALEEYRARLQQIEAGDLDVSPYLNRGKRLGS